MNLFEISYLADGQHPCSSSRSSKRWHSTHSFDDVRWYGGGAAWKCSRCNRSACSQYFPGWHACCNASSYIMPAIDDSSHGRFRNSECGNKRTTCAPCTTAAERAHGRWNIATSSTVLPVCSMAWNAGAADDDAARGVNDDATASNVNAWAWYVWHAGWGTTGDAHDANYGRWCSNDAAWAADAVCTHATTRPQDAGAFSSAISACHCTCPHCKLSP